MSLSPHRLYGFGPFRLEPAERLLLRDGQPVPLPPKAYDLLVTLVAHAGHLVTKEDLLREVWPGTFVEEANLRRSGPLSSFKPFYISKIGKTTDAIRGLDALRTLVGDGGPPYRVGYLGYLYGKTGHRTEALRAVSELRKRSATDHVPPVRSGISTSA
jgi:hypothetical protein